MGSAFYGIWAVSYTHLDVYKRQSLNYTQRRNLMKDILYRAISKKIQDVMDDEAIEEEVTNLVATKIRDLISDSVQEAINSGTKTDILDIHLLPEDRTSLSLHYLEKFI